MADQPKAAVWISDPWGLYGAAGHVDQVVVAEYPTHSPLLGPDGQRLQYAPKQPLGFDLRSRK